MFVIQRVLEVEGKLTLLDQNRVIRPHQHFRLFSTANTVGLGDTTGASGRIGLRTKWTIATAGGQVWQPYLRANLWRDWGADAQTVYSGTGVAPLKSRVTVLEVGGGLTVRINANVSVYANADYEFSVLDNDNVERNDVRGAVGARYSW